MMGSHINLEFQNFWKPPTTARHSQANRRLPLKWQLHGSIESSARKEASPAQGEPLNISSLCQRQTSAKPVVIHSDAESEEDDTLQSITEIAASISRERCGRDFTENHPSIPPKAERARQTQHEDKRPLPAKGYDRQEDVTTTVQLTDSSATQPAASCPPTPLGSILPLDQALRHHVRSKSCEITPDFTTTSDTPLTKLPDVPRYSPPLRRPSRDSTSSDGEQKATMPRGGSQIDYMHRITATSPKIAGSSWSCNSGGTAGETGLPESALGNSSDDDDCFGKVSNNNDDYCSSLTGSESQEQEWMCPADETDDAAEQRPRKRHMTRRAVASLGESRAGNASPLVAIAESSMTNEHPLAPALPQPRSRALDGDKGAAADTAVFEEWNGTVKLVTINGVTSFEGQFEGELNTKLFQALLQTMSVTQEGHDLLVKSTAGRSTQDVCRRGRFTPEEDDLLIELKKKRSLSWLDIHRRFSGRFPGRSQGALQVRFCTKLRDR